MIGFGFWGSAIIPTIITTDLLMWWDAGNLSSYIGIGTTIDDLTANNYDGTLNGATYSSVDGGKFVLDGVTNWINSIGTDSGDIAVGTSDFSVEMWIKPDNINQKGYCLNNRNLGTGAGLQTRFGSWSDVASKKLSFGAINSDSTRIYRVTTVDDIIDGGWKHIVCTRAGTVFKIYVNGVDKSFTVDLDTSIGLVINVASSTTWRMGIDFSNYSMEGDVSKIRLYNKTLSTIEVATNYDSEKSRYGL